MVSVRKDCFGATAKPARETRVLPVVCVLARSATPARLFAAFVPLSFRPERRECPALAGLVFLTSEKLFAHHLPCHSERGPFDSLCSLRITPLVEESLGAPGFREAVRA